MTSIDREENEMGELIDKAKGQVKQVQGDVTGNKALKREGIRDEIKGDLEGAAAKIKEAAKDIGSKVKDVFKKH